MRGGYTIIDFKNVPFTLGTGMVKEGVYETLESSRKPIRLCNLVIGNTEIRDVELVSIGANESDYTAVFPVATNQYQIVFNSKDVVTITSLND